MLIGNFCAICAAAVMAIYSSYTDSALKDAAQCPFYIYLAMTACFISGFSYVFSIYMQTPVHLFSADPVQGLFGIFMSSYLSHYFLGFQS